MAKTSTSKNIEFKFFGLKIFSIKTKEFTYVFNDDSFEDDFITEIEKRNIYKEDEGDDE